MRKIFFTLFILCLMSFSSTAQSDSIPSGLQKQFAYCEIIGTSSMLGSRITVKIDFGQKTKFFEDTRLKGKDGRPIRFNSMIDALNFMGSDGWELVQAYTTSVASTSTSTTSTPTSTSTSNTSSYIYHYLLKREIVK